MRIFNRRQNNGSNTTEPNALIQTGWGYIQGTGAAFASKTITLSQAYTSDYIVVVTQAGYKDTSTPTTIYDTTGAYEIPTMAARPLTTSTFTVIFNTPGTTAPSTRYILFHYMVIGT